MNHLKHCIIPLCTLFIYFNQVWEHACPNLKKLVLLQMTIIKSICGVNSRTSCDPLIEGPGFLRFADTNKYMIARFMCR